MGAKHPKSLVCKIEIEPFLISLVFSLINTSQLKELSFCHKLKFSNDLTEFIVLKIKGLHCQVTKL